jgi:hypothetical protein
MSDRGKRIFLLVTVIGSFVVYSLIYYIQVFKNAPYNRKEFKSFVFKYGTKDSMLNYYNSATGEYNYLNKHDSLIKTHLVLDKADIDSLHKFASHLGFWDFPSDEVNNNPKDPRYQAAVRSYIEFNYTKKSKQVTFDDNFSGPDKLVDANKGLIKDILTVLSYAEERERKNK